MEIIVRDANQLETAAGSGLLCSTLAMRLFVALDIEERIREQIVSFARELRTFAPGVRWVAPESLHVTLKFLGERPDAMAGKIEAALSRISAPAFQISFRGCGFFPTEKAARVFWVGIEADSTLAQLAKQIDGELESCGISPEKRAFSPHLTLARAGTGAPGAEPGDKPNRRFSALQAKLASMPALDFGSMTSTEFILYRSQLSGRGAQYSKIARFRMGDV